THARREVFALGLPERIADRRLTLLNHATRRIEVAQEPIDLFDRRHVGVAKAQVQREFRGDPPVILNEPRDRPPGHLDVRIADELRSAGRISGEEVFEWAGTSAMTVREPRCVAALEKYAPLCWVDVGIGLDVCELAAKLEGVPAPQIRDTVLQIVIRVGN